MLLAEVEIFHTRPAVPTRRVSLGHLVLPVEPAPGFGGLLLGAIVANHIVGVDEEMRADVDRLIDEVDRGGRIVQPRLRHRFQVDRHGLAVSHHQMFGDDSGAATDLEFEFRSTGSDLAQVLGAIYAVERLALTSRHIVAPILHKATMWRGPIGPTLIAYLAGSNSSALAALADPRTWAMQLLGFDTGGEVPSKREITKRYRDRMRAAHPDHGGAASDASKAILDLNEARRVLNQET